MYIFLKCASEMSKCIGFKVILLLISNLINVVEYDLSDVGSVKSFKNSLTCSDVNFYKCFMRAWEEYDFHNCLMQEHTYMFIRSSSLIV